MRVERIDIADVVLSFGLIFVICVVERLRSVMGDPSSCFKFNFALVSRVANSFAESSSYDLLRGERVDIDKARQEHETLVDALRRIGVDVVELPCDEKHPDGLFVDDVAVVINGTALICNPKSIQGRPSRQGEVCPV